MANNIIEMKNIIKNYYIGTPNELHIIKDVSFSIAEGSFTSIVGASGSGKSTLMNILGVLDRPTSGEYFLSGTSIAEYEDDELAYIRNKQVGFVFQTFNLIPKTSALKNVELPMLYAGIPQKQRTERAKELLDLVGMGERMKHVPNELSGGQKQRVAIARALANNPAIILADEPTGALDTETGRLVMDLFLEVNKQEGRTIVLITHNPELAEETDRIIELRDGQIVSDHITGGTSACI